jgi:hypothetical protein
MENRRIQQSRDHHTSKIKIKNQGIIKEKEGNNTKEIEDKE